MAHGRRSSCPLDRGGGARTVSSLDRRGGASNATLVFAAKLSRSMTIVAASSRGSQAVAYADSASDLPMLECAGFPVAVNPEAKLAAIARRRGWHVEHWARAATRPPLPMGPVDRHRSPWWARLDQLFGATR